MRISAPPIFSFTSTAPKPLLSSYTRQLDRFRTLRLSFREEKNSCTYQLVTTTNPILKPTLQQGLGEHTYRIAASSFAICVTVAVTMRRNDGLVNRTIRAVDRLKSTFLSPGMLAGIKVTATQNPSYSFCPAGYLMVIDRDCQSLYLNRREEMVDRSQLLPLESAMERDLIFSQTKPIPIMKTTWAAAIPESLSPEAGTLKSIRPPGSGDIATTSRDTVAQESP